MGLDCLPIGRPKTGFERDWRRLVQKMLFEQNELTSQEQEIYDSNIVHSYEDVGAPVVGRDPAANEWLLQKKPQPDADSEAALLREFDGYCVLDLVSDCDGIPAYSNGGLGDSSCDGVDQTCLRGGFIRACEYYFPEDHFVWEAWLNMWPEQAVEFGTRLLKLAESWENIEIEAARRSAKLAGDAKLEGQRKQGFWSKIFASTSKPLASIPEKPTEFDAKDFVEVAGRWYIYWGNKGHAIEADF